AALGRLRRVTVHVVRVRDAEVAVETLPRGEELGTMAEVPLPDARGGVAALPERLGDRPLLGGEPAFRIGKEDSPAVAAHAVSHGKAPGEKGGATRSANGRGRIELGEPHAFACHAVEMRRADRRMPVGGEIAVAEV